MIPESRIGQRIPSYHDEIFRRFNFVLSDIFDSPVQHCSPIFSYPPSWPISWAIVVWILSWRSAMGDGNWVRVWSFIKEEYDTETWTPLLASAFSQKRNNTWWCLCFSVMNHHASLCVLKYQPLLPCFCPRMIIGHSLLVGRLSQRRWSLTVLYHAARMKDTDI